jgi:hypothetical protein
MRSPGAAVGGILGPSVLADGWLIEILAGGSLTAFHLFLCVWMRISYISL